MIIAPQIVNYIYFDPLLTSVFTSDGFNARIITYENTMMDKNIAICFFAINILVHELCKFWDFVNNFYTYRHHSRNMHWREHNYVNFINLQVAWRPYKISVISDHPFYVREICCWLSIPRVGLFICFGYVRLVGYLRSCCSLVSCNFFRWGHPVIVFIDCGY